MSTESQHNVTINLFHKIMCWDASPYLKVVWLLQTAKHYADQLKEDDLIHEFEALQSYYLDAYLRKTTKLMTRKSQESQIRG